MTKKTVYDEISIPAVWDAELVLDFFDGPGFDAFDQWIDGALSELEQRWPAGNRTVGAYPWRADRTACH